MPYFKNSELAYTYHVSDRTVRNWVALAREGKLPLELETLGDKAYVAKTSGNIKIIEEYVARNKTKRPRNALKFISPSKKFYKLFTPAQVYDIVRNLEMHHEIPRQYNYFDGGASEWDEYIKQLAKENTHHIFTATLTLLEETEAYIKNRLAKYDKINVVDVGVGNGLQAIGLLEFLAKEQKLGRYIAIDISPEMLEIAEQNIHNAIAERILVEKYEMDVTHERFANILAESYLRKDSNKSANLILLLGATPINLRNPDDMFRTVSESMSGQDFLVYTGKLESEDQRPEWLKHDVKPGKMTLSNRHKLVFDLLNIDESFYDVEVGFDEKSRQQYTLTRLKVAINLCFEFDEGERIIEFEKGDTILLWRAWQIDASDMISQLTETGFEPLYSIQTDDREYMLTISQAKLQK